MISIIGAILLGVAVVFYVGNLVRRQARERLPDATPDADAREKAAEALWQIYPAFPEDEPETALFLLEESKRSYDGWIESNTRIESKATSLTSILAGGAGVLSLFGSHGASGALQPGPFLFLALSAAAASFVCCLYILRPKLRTHPGVSDYVAPAVALYPLARFHIMLSLAEGYNLAVLKIAKLRRFDGVAWSGAQVFLGLAVIALLLHFGLSGGAGKGSQTIMVQCHGQAGSFKSGAAWKTSCKEQPDGR